MNSPLGESSQTFLKNKQTNKLSLSRKKTKQKYPWKWFVTRMMFTIHQKRFSFLKNSFISFFTNGANRPGVNRPVRKMVLERIVPGGTGFGANRPVTIDGMLHLYRVIAMQNVTITCSLYFYFTMRLSRPVQSNCFLQMILSPTCSAPNHVSHANHVLSK